MWADGKPEQTRTRTSPVTPTSLIVRPAAAASPTAAAAAERCSESPNLSLRSPPSSRQRCICGSILCLCNEAQVFRISSINCETLLPAFCPRLLLREISASLSASLYPPASHSFPQLTLVLAQRVRPGGERGRWGGGGGSSGFTENSFPSASESKYEIKTKKYPL